jgi:hypothetical protein
MNLIDAIKSGRPFRRKLQDRWLESVPAMLKDDILADDWELKPEEPRKAREFWVYVDGMVYMASERQLPRSGQQKDPIHVREVLPGSVQVDYASFKAAYESVQDSKGYFFDHLCKALGVEDV